MDKKDFLSKPQTPVDGAAFKAAVSAAVESGRKAKEALDRLYPNRLRGII